MNRRRQLTEDPDRSHNKQSQNCRKNEKVNANFALRISPLLAHIARRTCESLDKQTDGRTDGRRLQSQVSMIDNGETLL